MKQHLFLTLLLCLLLVNCTEQPKNKEVSSPIKPINNKVDLPTKTIEKSSLYYNKQTSLWLLNEQPYSGYVVDHYDDQAQTLKEKFGVLDGKKQNESIQFYPDGHYQDLAHYHKGKLHGIKKRWTADSTHVLIAHLNYHLGKAHGEQRKWYPTGELFKVLHLNMGKEEGIQQAFRKNGDLYANYEAREGRIFGLKKAALCFELEEEEVQDGN